MAQLSVEGPAPSTLPIRLEIPQGTMGVDVRREGGMYLVVAVHSTGAGSVVARYSSVAVAHALRFFLNVLLDL